jgi:hypothetical protein
MIKRLDLKTATTKRPFRVMGAKIIIIIELIFYSNLTNVGNYRMFLNSLIFCLPNLYFTIQIEFVINVLIDINEMTHGILWTKKNASARF